MRFDVVDSAARIGGERFPLVGIHAEPHHFQVELLDFFQFMAPLCRQRMPR